MQPEFEIAFAPAAQIAHPGAGDPETGWAAIAHVAPDDASIEEKADHYAIAVGFGDTQVAALADLAAIMEDVESGAGR